MLPHDHHILWEAGMTARAYIAVCGDEPSRVLGICRPPPLLYDTKYFETGVLVSALAPPNVEVPLFFHIHLHGTNTDYSQTRHAHKKCSRLRRCQQPRPWLTG